MSKEAALAAFASTAPAPVTAEVTPVATTETPTATPEAVKTQDSDRFAAFARKEAELVKKQQAWKQEKETWEKGDKTKTDAVLAKATQFEELRKTDPVAALKLIGFSETEIFNFLAASETKELTPEEKAAKIAEEKADAKISEWEKKKQEEAAKLQAEEDEKTLTAFKINMETYAAQNKEKYPYFAHLGKTAAEQAYQNIIKTLQDSNGADNVTIDQAIEDMEELYRYEYEQMKKIYEPVSNTPPSNAEAVKEKLERSKTVSAPGKLSAAPTTKKTLTNAGTATSTGISTPVNETRDQKKARLAAQLAAMQRRA